MFCSTAPSVARFEQTLVFLKARQANQLAGNRSWPAHRPVTLPSVTQPAADRSQRFGALTERTEPFAPGDWGVFVSIALIWGSSFLLIAIGLESLKPGLITFMRVGLGALALLAVPGRSTRIEQADRSRMVLLSVVWTAIPFTLFPIAEQYINSAVTGLLNGSTPIMVAIVATVVLGQRPRGPQLAGIVLGFIGVIAISIPSLGEGATQALGVCLVLAATVCYGFAMNLAAPLQQKYGSVAVMRSMLLMATVWTAPYGLWDARTSTFEWGPVIATVVLGVAGTGLAFALMGTLVGRVGSTRASFITYLIPGISLALGVVFQGDEVSPLAIVGVCLVVAGAFMASRSASAS